MSYKIEKIQGIGAHFASLLVNAKVFTTSDLLRHAKSDGGLQHLAERTTIGLPMLEAWAARADLMRVSGIGPQFGELLEASGVESVVELSTRNPENLVNLLARVNAEKKLTRSIPTLHTLKRWVTEAEEMVPHDKRIEGAVSAVSAVAVASEGQDVPVMMPVAPIAPRPASVGIDAGADRAAGMVNVPSTGMGPYRPS